MKSISHPFSSRALKAVPAACAFFIATAAHVVAEAPKVRPEQVYEPLGKLALPAALVAAPDGSDRMFLVQQAGKIVILPADRDAEKAEVFLDVSGQKLIANQFEEGLLGLAFHPKFTDNRKFYIYHTLQAPKRTRVVELTVSEADRDVVEMESARVLLEIPQPFWNHNSGNILFGPDDLLYIGVGDGGKGGDPLQLAQNVFVLNGSILRIDVDGRDGDLEYAIPKDNPFVGKKGPEPGHRAEIYCYGMRNPWGLSFDKAGNFWCADVGQAIWEEINLIVKGGNYGWSIREGLDAFPEAKGSPKSDAKLIDPIHQYPHTDGISITGGFVYEGEAIPELKGSYIYGDWAFGTLWALRYDFEKKEVAENSVIYKRGEGDPELKPTAIVPGPDGEIMVSSWDGKVYQLKKAE